MESNGKGASVAASQLTKAEPVTLSWENIDVTVPAKKSLITRKVTAEAVQILKDVSGVVQPGSLLAIMGASGSGKTTLLNVLTQRSASDLLITGKIKVNGKAIGPAITKMSAYVQQDDLFVGILTVREHLWFQAMLRMGENISDEDRNKRIDEVISELGLTRCKDSVIGIPDKVKSISGGERKRLSFASEILTNPPLMFCDEPTSGLDSFMAENVVQTLRSMATSGKTILCTIHQPSSQIFNLFDNLLLLARGEIAYMGPTAGTADFFASHGLVCPSKFNPADFYITSLAVVPGHESESMEKIQKICKSYKEQRGVTLSSSSSNGALGAPSAVEYSDSVDYSKTAYYKTGFWNQMRYVSWRAWVVSMRDRNLFFARFGQTIVIALFAGLLYLRQSNNQKAIQNINGAIFLILANSTFGNAFSVVSSFPLELPVFRRDYQNHMYSPFVYFMAKSLADIPIFTFLPIIFATIIYWMVGLKSDVEAFFIFVATVVYLTHVVVSFGYLISCAAGDVTIATALGGPLVVPFMLFGGYMINDASIPVYFIWLQYLSWFKYAFEILVINQWHNFGAIGCEYGDQSHNNQMMTAAPDSSGLPSYYGGAPPGYLRNNFTMVTTPANPAAYMPPCVTDGEQVLDNYPRDFGAMAALFIGFRLVAFIFLAIRVSGFPDVRKLFKKKVDDDNKVSSVKSVGV